MKWQTCIKVWTWLKTTRCSGLTRAANTGLKAVLFTACLLPLASLVWAGFSNDLTADPIKYITHHTGEWGLRFLLLTLAVTPLRKISNNPWIGRTRRMIGLFAYFYVTLHLLTYALLDLGLDWGHLAEDILKRPYITVGFAAFLILTALAVTSTKGMMRRLGRGWKKLHRGVYIAAALGCLHFLWLVKADLREPIIYTAVLTLLLTYRLIRRNRRRAPAAGSTSTKPSNAEGQAA